MHWQKNYFGNRFHRYHMQVVNNLYHGDKNSFLLSILLYNGYFVKCYILVLYSYQYTAFVQFFIHLAFFVIKVLSIFQTRLFLWLLTHHLADLIEQYLPRQPLWFVSCVTNTNDSYFLTPIVKADIINHRNNRFFSISNSTELNSRHYVMF